jgi:hypothetical protein
MPGGTAKADLPTTGSLPAIVGVKQTRAAR